MYLRADAQVVAESQPQEWAQNFIEALSVRLPADLDEEGDAAGDLLADCLEPGVSLLLCKLVRLDGEFK